MPRFTVVGTWDDGTAYVSHIVARDTVHAEEITDATVRTVGLSCVILDGHVSPLDHEFPKLPAVFFNAVMAMTKLPMPKYPRESEQTYWLQRDKVLKSYLTWYRSQP